MPEDKKHYFVNFESRMSFLPKILALEFPKLYLQETIFLANNQGIIPTETEEICTKEYTLPYQEPDGITEILNI